MHPAFLPTSATAPARQKWCRSAPPPSPLPRAAELAVRGLPAAHAAWTAAPPPAGQKNDSRIALFQVRVLPSPIQMTLFGGQDFPHTRHDCCSRQSTQTGNQAQKGNMQINKNNIRSEAYQGVAKYRQHGIPPGNLRFFMAVLGLAGKNQQIKATPQTGKIDPSQPRTEE